MLIRFEVSNFRSIRHPAELTLVAVDRDRPEARPVPNLGESLLPVAGLYGPNASGKSNVLAALTWLTQAVRDSVRTWDETIPVEPFAFADGRERPTDFTVEYVVDGVRFEYVLELDRERVHYEGLFHYPEKKRRRIFEREDGELRLQRGLGALSGTREIMTDRTLALSAARRFGEPLLSAFSRRLLGTRTGATPRTGRRAFGVRLPSAEAIMRLDRSRALALLRLADLGIEDMRFERRELSDPFDPTAPTTAIHRMRLVHRSGDEQVPFELASESEGTLTWLGIIAPVLGALEDGSALLFDELDASLHPTLSAQLIRLFHDPATNPAGAQLIFTSHDTSLLNHLNRDEVWLTEKGDDGSTRLGALSDFAGERVRRSQNIERAYLHGRFGALPDVDRAELLRALGLIG